MQISWKNVFLLAALLFALPLTGTPAQAAGLFGDTPAGDSVFVGEVQSYGDYELKADACATFVDKLAEALRQQGMDHLKPERIPEILDGELPQQAIAAAFRKYKK